MPVSNVNPRTDIRRKSPRRVHLVIYPNNHTCPSPTLGISFSVNAIVIPRFISHGSTRRRVVIYVGAEKMNTSIYLPE